MSDSELDKSRYASIPLGGGMRALNEKLDSHTPLREQQRRITNESCEGEISLPDTMKIDTWGPKAR